MIKRAFFVLFFPLLASAFEISPWLSPIAEFELRSSYSYRHYPKVNRAVNPSKYSSSDHLIDFNLAVNFWPDFDFQLEADFTKTRRLSWGAQLIGTQVRYIFLDDVAGDLVTLAGSIQAFYVPTRNMQDVSSPYHAQGNLEVGLALGKEISKEYDWLYRFYGFLGVGEGNRGSPWLRPVLSFALNIKNRHRFETFAEGYFGLGNRRLVNIDQFNGYARIRHQSVDVGANYRYEFKVWGSLGVQCSYRVYARSFPQNTSILTVEYRLPFSLL